MAFNTVPPGDYQAFELLNDVVQQEPATALDPELMGPLAAVGIVKGKPSAPDGRMKKIMTEAAALANATSRSLFLSPPCSGLVLLSRLRMAESAFYQRLSVRHANSSQHARGRQTLPDHRLPDARRAVGFFLRHHRHHTGDEHAVLPGIGSQYLFATR